MSRREDWPERLHEFLEAARSRPFQWGETDCCLFVCDAVLAITDVDLAQDFRGCYSDEAGATKVMQAYIVNAAGMGAFAARDQLLEEFASRIATENGIAGTAVAFAWRGDVVLFDQDLEIAGDLWKIPTLGIVGLHGTHAVSTAPAGPVEIPVSECRKAWRIG
jgi:hypothetical protein